MKEFGHLLRGNLQFVMGPITILVCTLLFMGLAVVGPVLANAPMFEKGARTIHGSFSFSSAGDGFFQNAEGDRTQEWTLTPGGGYFIASGVALTLAIEGSWFTLGEVTSSEYSMGPVLEYYFDTVGDDDPQGHTIPYLGAGYLWGTVKEETATSNTKYVSSLLTLTAGLAWMMSDHIATDIAINYRVGEYTEKYPLDGAEYAANRWSVFIGIKGFIF